VVRGLRMGEARTTRSADPLTEAAFRRLEESPDRCADWMLTEVRRLTERYRFFHWHLEFPDVFRLPASNVTPDNPETGWNGGFDLVLGNPPWDILSPDTKEFFSTYDPQIRAEDRNGQARIMERLLADPLIGARWRTYQRDIYVQAHFFRNSRLYRLFASGNLGAGHLNIFRMFVEAALYLTKDGGYTTQIIPDSFYLGANCMAIRERVLSYHTLTHLWSFQNFGEVWFPGIYYRMKFCLYAAKKTPATKRFSSAFNIRSQAQLAEVVAGADLAYPIELVREFSPDALAIMEFDDQREIDISSKMYVRWPKLGDARAGPPFREYRRKVDMGNDRNLFTEDPAGLPVYEGRMVGHYDHRAKGYKSGCGRSAEWEEFPFGDPGKRIQPQWRVLEHDLPAKLGDRPFRYRIGFCDVASPTNERSLTAVLIPGQTIAGHKVPTITFPSAYEWSYLLWLAVANSFTMDFLVRKKVSLTMSYTIMDSLPFPRLPIKDPRVAALAPRVLQLTCIGQEMILFWNAMAAHGWVESVPESAPAPGASDPEHRLQLTAEIEVIVARDLFGLTADELDYVLETFPIVKRRDIRKHGDFRTKLMILAAYATFQTIKTTDEPQQTRVTPLSQHGHDPRQVETL